MQKGIPQGSLLGPLPFTLHKTNIGANIADAFIQSYFAATDLSAHLQDVFIRVQKQLLKLLRVLNSF